MEAAVAALQDEAHVIKSRRINREGRQYLQDECSKLGLGFIPSIANFLSINIGPRSLDICDELMRQGVVVRPLAEYSMPHYLRVTIGLQEENERFISALRHILEIDAV